MAMVQPTLWGSSLCPFVIRTRIMMALAAKQYVFKPVDILNKPKGLLKISPYGKVPILEAEEGVIWESAAINQYIDDKWAGGNIMGHNAYNRAMHRVWTHWCNTRASPTIYNALFNQDKAKDAELLAKVDECFGFLEEKLPVMKEKGLFQPESNYAFSDVMVTPFLQRLPLLAHFRGYKPPSSSKLPHVAKLVDGCNQRVAKLDLKGSPVTTEELIHGYEPYATGKIPVSPNVWVSY